ncbi:SDR family NAD(P)-dependent oxidoreductase [Agrobacterium vitis]|uniref:SDR family NAD(P)-dependent oxidoreductase n=2 Tax=Agrobacterium vitis TaxID=373 RepID=A0ABD6GBQ4_AGRVI|nr:SDR family NAD(P)-dependent oxidoreductase [Agrobacterium vitis]MUO80397.1 SDR family NAD(P)-dependent oxidoreductase [Agrobacterium vitis]MUO97890.1 SDR family NAD(P)-dependent oxidoreductase [Agrobacterium vitis]MUP03764.1 SDR family NAD(P)-dependent oxidoreductase [Agrobacterium vitis]MUZ83364.1 SDR family NAD(P)-dependent oxidoreductase [Agrobacterium vitis]MVA12983.1 SDR family NAD(P)-dependent oxidoreductase [Agrobacterium vitis]
MTSLRPSYSALVIGASGGIGSALCAILGSDSACREVVTLSRRENGFDLMEEASIAACAERLAGQDQSFDLIICATGALTINGVGPEKAIKAVTSEAMAAQFALNAIGPALVLKYFTPLLVKNSRSLMGFLSARVGSIGDNRLGGWISYRASKAALNQIVHTSAIEIARSRPQSVIVSLHPGSVDTGLSANFAAGHERFAPDHSAGLLLSVLDILSPAQTGGFFAYDGSVIEW